MVKWNNFSQNVSAPMVMILHRRPWLQEVLSQNIRYYIMRLFDAWNGFRSHRPNWQWNHKFLGFRILRSNNSVFYKSVRMGFSSDIISVYSSINRSDRLGGDECRCHTNHSIASSRPMPLVADVLNIWYFLFFIDESPRALATSAGVIEPSISCLLANTTSTAPPNSSSWNREKKQKIIAWIIPGHTPSMIAYKTWI